MMAVENLSGKFVRFSAVGNEDPDKCADRGIGDRMRLALSRLVKTDGRTINSRNP